MWDVNRYVTFLGNLPELFDGISYVPDRFVFPIIVWKRTYAIFNKNFSLPIFCATIIIWSFKNDYSRCYTLEESVEPGRTTLDMSFYSKRSQFFYTPVKFISTIGTVYQGSSVIMIIDFNCHCHWWMYLCYKKTCFHQRIGLLGGP